MIYKFLEKKKLSFFCPESNYFVLKVMLIYCFLVVLLPCDILT